jgi:hypothetical protein
LTHNSIQREKRRQQRMMEMMGKSYWWCNPSHWVPANSALVHTKYSSTTCTRSLVWNLSFNSPTRKYCRTLNTLLLSKFGRATQSYIGHCPRNWGSKSKRQSDTMTSCFWKIQI